jgi:hypothetical protein
MPNMQPATAVRPAYGAPMVSTVLLHGVPRPTPVTKLLLQSADDNCTYGTMGVGSLG